MRIFSELKLIWLFWSLPPQQVAPGEASFADRSQKGPLAYQKLFESVIDGLTTSSQKKSSLVVVALEGGVADDGLGVLKAGQSKGQFPVGYLYLERHDHLKGIARVLRRQVLFRFNFLCCAVWHACVCDMARGKAHVGDFRAASVQGPDSAGIYARPQLQPEEQSERV